MRMIDNFLDNITMYRLVLYYLTILIVLGVILSFFKILPYEPLAILFSFLVLVTIGWLSNKFLAKLFKATSNLESMYITCFILVLITGPNSFKETPFLILVATIAMASKYLLAINKKHLFNPSALAVVLTGFFMGQGASWWVGNPYLLPVLAVGGFLILRKTKRFKLFLCFWAVVLAVLVVNHTLSLDTLALFIFFGSIMLVEPQTTPLQVKWQILYATTIGLMTIHFTPELSLLAGNIFAFLVNPKKYFLKLKQKINLGNDIFEFSFNKPIINYQAGQFMEWTLGHSKPDTRGERRFFTIASSSTEPDLKIGVKFSKEGSSFKKALLAMEKGDTIIAGSLSGSFTLPIDQNKKLVFIAGGIGITPFRSMIKYLIDTGQNRDIILFYSCKTKSEFVYQDIFDQAKSLGLKPFYIETETMGYVDDTMIRKEVPDFKDRLFYLSGPHSMVNTFEDTLNKMGLPRRQIKVDYFPGYT